jgi:23S rRNA (guanosine2251-2'-O)-methyltransferase
LTVAGWRAVRMALTHATPRIRKIALSKTGTSRISDFPSGVPLVSMDEEEMDSMVDTGVRHGGVLAWVQRPTAPSVKELAGLSKGRRGPIVALDGVTDPRNLGAILRNAAWFDVPALIVPKRHTAELTSAAVTASAGAACMVPVVQVPNLARALDLLKAEDIWIYSADRDPGSVTFNGAPLHRPAALIIGDEGRGIRPNVADRADVHIHIPGQNVDHLDSLNVSVAAGVLLSAFYNLPYPG